MLNEEKLKETLKWPLHEMRGCLINNPNFTGEILICFYRGGVSRVKISEEKYDKHKLSKKKTILTQGRL